MAPGSCEICRVLGTGSAAPDGRGPPSAVSSRREGRNRLSLGVTAVTIVVALVTFAWLAATIWAVVRLLELVAVAFGAGWIGWRLGVRHGRQNRP